MSRAKESPKKRHQRQVRVSVVLPAAVTLVVGTDDADPSEDSDWEILSVVNTHCEATPRLVEESMHANDFAALAATAANAKDLP